MSLAVYIDWQRSGSSGPPQPPTDVADLALWWRAGDLAHLADGSPIGIWPSVTGSSNATQTTASKQPTKQTVSGRPCVRFDGSNDWLSLSGDALTVSQNKPGVSIFARAKVTPAAATKRLIYLSTGSVNNDARSTLYVNSSDLLTTGSRRLDADSAQNITGTAPGSTNIRVMTGILDYANSDALVYLDGTLAGSSTSFQTSGNTSNTASVAAALGGRADGAAEFLGMDLYEVLVWPRAVTSSERTLIETYLLAGGLLAEDVAALVRSRQAAVTAAYGRDQSTALAPTVSGRGSLVLDNRDKRFSPRNTSSPLYGYVKPARPVKIVRTISGTDHVLFVAHTDDNPINPDVNNKTVTVSLVDSLADFRGLNISTPLYSGTRTGQAIGYILDACGWPSSLRDLDAGATVIPWWWADNEDALTALEKVLRSEGPPALLTVGADGSIVFKDRHHRLTDTASLTSQQTWRAAAGVEPVMQALEYDEAWRNIVNTGTVSVDVRQPAELQAVWTSDATITLSSGEQRIITATATDPFINAVVPEAGTDYTLLSGTVTVTLTRTSGASVGIVLTSTGASTLSGLQLRAQPLSVAYTTQVTASDTASISDFGQRSYPSDLPWCNAYDAQAVLNTAVALRAQPLPVIQVGFQIADADKAAMLLARDISDRVTIVEAETNLNTDFYIESISHELASGRDHVITFGLEMVPPANSNVFQFDVAGHGFNDGLFGAGIDEPSTMFRFDTASHGFNDGLWCN